MSTTTTRKELFVEEYLKDFNQTNAVIKAGYSPNGARTRGSLLMDDPYVQVLLKRRLDERKRLALYDEQFIIECLKEVCARCLQKTPAKASSDEIWAFDSTGALRALELLGKHIGMFNPKLLGLGESQNTPSYPVNITIIQATNPKEPFKDKQL